MYTTIRSLKIFIVLLFFINTSLFAQINSDNDLYSIKYYKLANGLEIYLKPRFHSKSVAIRIAVKVGSKDFSCRVRETAHYLEHLIFSGTPQISEQQLEEIFKEYGGTTNAKTRAYETTYEVSVHRDFTIPALKLYHTMLTASDFSEENILLSQNIVFREGRGKSGAIRKWLYDHDFQKYGINKAYEQIFSLDEFCPSYDNLENITREKILEAFGNFYVPNNMAVFVVGDFDPEKILEHLKSTFGTLISKAVKHRVIDHQPPNLTAQTVESTLIPLVDNEASVTFLFRTVGFESSDSFPIVVLSEYLNDKMYNELRINQGLSYNPSARRKESHEEGILILNADINVEDIEKTKRAIFDILSDVQNDKIDIESFRRIKKYFLLLFDMGYESNNSFANLYSSYWRDFEKNGVYMNIRDKISSITAADLESVIAKYLVNDKLIIAIDKPSLTFTQFAVILLVALLFFIIIMTRIYRRYRINDT